MSPLLHQQTIFSAKITVACSIVYVISQLPVPVLPRNLPFPLPSRFYQYPFVDRFSLCSNITTVLILNLSSWSQACALEHKSAPMQPVAEPPAAIAESNKADGVADSALLSSEDPPLPDLEVFQFSLSKYQCELARCQSFLICG